LVWNAIAEFFKLIINQAVEYGNFSFAILLVGLWQVSLMYRRR
jgi:hypothetical protein